MIKYKIICDKEIRFRIGYDLKKVTINEFINKVNNIFEKYQYDERIINNHYIYISQYYDINNLLMLLYFNPCSYDINDEYILYTSVENLDSYSICSLIHKLINDYYDIIMEALGYDI